MGKIEPKKIISSVFSSIIDIFIYKLSQVFVQFSYAFVIYFRNLNPDRTFQDALRPAMSGVNKNQTLLAFVSIIVAAVIIGLKHSEKNKRNILIPKCNKVRIHRTFLWIVSGFTFSFSVYIVLTLLSLKNHYISHQTDINMAYYLVVCIITPAAEELLFRNIVMKKLSDSMGLTAAAILQALMFSAIHSGLSQKIYTFILAMILGIAVIKTHNIIIPVIIHMIFNITGTGIINISGLSVKMYYILLTISAGISAAIFIHELMVNNNEKKLTLTSLKLPVKH